MRDRDWHRSEDALRHLRGGKWAQYGADVLPAWVADMDFRVADPVPGECELEPTPAEAVQDEQGVDRSQIRAFLDLTPRQRLERASHLAGVFLRVRQRNGHDRY